MKSTEVYLTRDGVYHYPKERKQITELFHYILHTEIHTDDSKRFLTKNFRTKLTEVIYSKTEDGYKSEPQLWTSGEEIESKKIRFYTSKYYTHKLIDFLNAGETNGKKWEFIIKEIEDIE